MAWRSSGKSNAELVANLCRNGMIKDDRVKEAFLKVRPSTVTHSHSTPRVHSFSPLLASLSYS